MESCPLNRHCQIGEVVYEAILSSNQPNYKKKRFLELRKNLSKDAYTTKIYLSEMNFIKTTQELSKELW